MREVGVRVAGVGKTYRRNGPAAPLPALQDIDLTIGPGEFVSLLGPSGCGKSSLLRLLAGLGRPSAGSITWSGAGPAGPDLALVPQEPTLMPWKRVFDNVYLPLRLAGQTRRAAREAVAGALDAMGLSGVAEAFPRQLSGGMRMRVSIARALVSAPRVLLMDEPFAALDEITRNRLDDELLALQQRHRLTVVFVTHSVSEAVYLSSRIVVMRTYPGRIAEDIALELPAMRDAGTRVSAAYLAGCARVSAALQQSA